MKEYPKVQTETRQDGQALEIVLNDPKANVLDSIMMASISEVLSEAGQQQDLKCLIFRGAGDHFSFGASVPEHTKENAPEMLKQFHGLFYQLADLAIPTVAMISGQCLGGGFELALMCDFMFTDESASCGQPEIRLGVFAPPASLILPLKIGQVKAEEILLTGNLVSGQTLKELGLCIDVFPNQEAMQSGGNEWISKNLLPKSASSLKRAVKASRWRFNRHLRKHLAELEKFYINDLMKTKDANEGIRSFLERRKPKWGNS